MIVFTDNHERNLQDHPPFASLSGYFDDFRRWKIKAEVKLSLSFRSIEGTPMPSKEDNLLFVNPVVANDFPIDKSTTERQNEGGIQSDGQNSRKMDLTISATKEESMDRYSPRYNAANPLPIQVTDTTKTSRQDSVDTLYQPSESTEIIPFDAMRHYYEQQFFSPLQTLRHLEDNLAREVLPLTLGHSINKDNNEASIGMVVPHSYHPYYDVVPIIDSPPHPIQIMQNVPVNLHSKDNMPHKTPELNQQRLLQGYHAPNSNRHPEPLPEVTHRHPDHNAQPNSQNSSPEKHILNQSPDRLKYSNHRGSQPPPENIPPHYSTLRNPIHNKVVQNNIDSNQLHSKPKNAELNRHLYYGPLNERFANTREPHPSLTLSEVSRPINDNYLNRNRVIPQQDYRETYSMHDNKQLHPRNPPKLYHVPQYTVVPYQNLPRYLQNQNYFDGIQSSDRNIPQSPSDTHRPFSKYPQSPTNIDGQESPKINIPHSIPDNRHLLTNRLRHPYDFDRPQSSEKNVPQSLPRNHHALAKHLQVSSNLDGHQSSERNIPQSLPGNTRPLPKNQRNASYLDRYQSSQRNTPLPDNNHLLPNRQQDPSYLDRYQSSERKNPPSLRGNHPQVTNYPLKPSYLDKSQSLINNNRPLPHPQQERPYIDGSRSSEENTHQSAPDNNRRLPKHQQDLPYHNRPQSSERNIHQSLLNNLRPLSQYQHDPVYADGSESSENNNPELSPGSGPSFHQKSPDYSLNTDENKILKTNSLPTPYHSKDVDLKKSRVQIPDYEPGKQQLDEKVKSENNVYRPKKRLRNNRNDRELNKREHIENSKRFEI
ncbi:uncharacterized protein CDAR_222131 [Caerostris darwini]|uniref:Uncharacterized protein n=1 Tax=Caerostris darwini TaxID=1538125 RepID=A0AAV4P7T3_9ARAC|nr:uncharacterized protein CDAR_222131 [Caerostris darwini]